MNYMEFKQELSDFVLCGIGSSRQGNLSKQETIMFWIQ